MIESGEYIESVERYFSFLETEFGYTRSRVSVIGNAFYDVEYEDGKSVISISYENVEDHLEIIYFELRKGIRPDYDDTTRTHHLSELNRRAMAQSNGTEIDANAILFARFVPRSPHQRVLIKKARELRLCLKILWPQLRRSL